MGLHSTRVDRSTLRTLLSAATSDAVCRRTVGIVSKEIDADRTVLAFEDDEALQAVQIAGRSGEQEWPRSWSDPTDCRMRSFQNGESVLVEDLRDTRSVSRVSTTPRSLLCVPVGDRGVLFVESTEANAFGSAHRSWLEQLAADVATALDRFEGPVDELGTGTGASADETILVDQLADRIPFVLDATDSILWAIHFESSTLQLFGPTDRILGIEDGAELDMWEFVEDYVHPNDAQRVTEQLGDVSDGDAEQVELNCRLTSQESDSGRWFRAQAALADGSHSKLIGLSTDVSSRHDREQRIKYLQRRTTRLIGAQSETRIANIAVNAANEALSLPFSGIHLRNGDVLEPTAVNESTWDEFGELPTYRKDSSDPVDEVVWGVYGGEKPLVVRDTSDDDQLGGVPSIGGGVVYPLDDHGVFVTAAREPNAFESIDVALGEVLAASITAALDRTEQEHRLREQAAELEHKNEQLEEFTSIVSHDLRNPLNVALGRVEYVRDQRDDEHLAAAERALERMERIIDETLVLARAGRRVDAVESVPVAETVEACWENVATGDATLEADFDPAEPTVPADKERLAHVFENLFTNAVEHGGDNVTITVGILPDRTGLYVEDDGPGIPVDERERVFDSGFTTAEDGTGFGLALVADIVEAHGWEIAVTDRSVVRESDESGARFEITGITKSS